MTVDQGYSESSPHNPTEQWTAVAKQWGQIGQPLRPSAQDIAFVSQAVSSWANSHDIPRALILGVTPELYNLPWPAGADIIAVDHTQAMIDVVWPGPRDAAICAEWTDLPLPEKSRDIAVCDGGIILLQYPEGHRKFAEELSRIITPDGLCVLRLFVPPANDEDPESVLLDLMESRMGNLNLLKLRLGMAMQANAVEGVQLNNVWKAIHKVAPDLNQLADKISWPLEHLLAINAYRGRTATYHFLDVDQVLGIFCAENVSFALESVQWPDYELGDRCPTITLRKLG